ncbi:MAG: ribosomal-processing cysteine protease Prp [Termitinemataceae bacterium]
MLTIDVVLDSDGLLQACGISGHANAGPKGADIVCAAVSILARTALKTLSGKKGIVVQGKAPKRGAFSMEVRYTEDATAFVSGVTEFLLEGFGSISKEYPDHCMVHITTERR